MNGDRGLETCRLNRQSSPTAPQTRSCRWREERHAARERISALTNRRHSGLPRLTGARWFDLRAEMFSAETVPTEQ